MSLGYILKFGDDNSSPPSGPEVKGLVCVRKELCEKGEAESYSIWEGAGSKAKSPLSLFLISPKDRKGLELGTFYGTSRPLEEELYVLSMSKVTLNE